MFAFTGEVRIVGFDFAPKGWASCDGQLLPVGQFGALFRLIGNRFGGDGVHQFALPDLSDGRIVLGTGAGPALTPRAAGDSGGVTTVTLTDQTMPPHTHLVFASNQPGDVSTPTTTTALARSNGGAAYGASKSLQPFDARTVSTVPGGGGQPHNNVMPYQALFYCICLQEGPPATD
jgi:microcystin-dependent protein